MSEGGGIVDELTPDAVAERHRKVTMTGIAMMAGSATVMGLMMYGMAQTLKGPSAESASQVPLMRLLFLAVCLLDAAPLAMFRFWMIPSGLSKMLAQGAPDGAPATPEQAPVKVFGIELRPSGPTYGRQKPLDYLFTMTLSIWAICVTPVVLGFVMWVMSRLVTDLAIFWTLSLLLALTFVPRLGTWHEWVARAKAAAAIPES